jgi:FkbM family methyltransferase
LVGLTSRSAEARQERREPSSNGVRSAYQAVSVYNVEYMRELEPRLPVRLLLARTVCRLLPPVVARRLTNALYPARRGKRDDHEFVARSVTGSLFRGRTSDYYGHQFAVTRFFAWKNAAVATAVCRPGDTVIDIGANVGTETLAYRDIVGSSGRVYAIEPLPENQSALEDLIELNAWTNVVVVPVALGDKRHSVEFMLPPPDNSGTGYVVAPGSQPPGEVVTVECSTLDSMSDVVGRATAVFSDTEGAEVAVLRGAHNYLRRHAPVYTVEVAPEWLARAGASPADLLRELNDLDYRVFALGPSGLAAVRTAHASSADWVCVPRDKEHVVPRISQTIRRCGGLPPVRGLNPLTARHRSHTQARMD